jgi:tol-pal system protein YbgF
MLNRVAYAAVASVCVMALPTGAFAQVGPAELLVRIDRLENQIRQLTGEIEQMQYRNQQLEAALRRLQDDSEFRFQELGSRGGSRATTARPGTVLPNQPGPPVGRRSDGFDPVENPSAPGAPRVLGSNQPGLPVGRRSDAFDPAENPNAPGAPRVLGSNQPGPPVGRRSDAFDPVENPNAPGAPRVLGSIPPQSAPMMSPQRATGVEPYGAGGPAGVDPGSGRLPTGAAPRNPGFSAPDATAPPSSSPRDILLLGTGYLQRKDYALAEEAFREFLTKYPSDRLAGEAQFGLGESLFQRQGYHEAANAFVVLSKKYETSTKAPDALLRLGQSLAAINERELACVAFGDVSRKYPRASPSVKQAIERELKHARC